jgi:carbon storage regulator
MMRATFALCRRAEPFCEESGKAETIIEDGREVATMLVLSRKPLEAVVIGDGVKITVLRIDRNQVRLGIEAPNHVSVLRAELIEQVRAVADTFDPKV